METFPAMTFIGLSAQPGREITKPVTLSSQSLGDTIDTSGCSRAAFHAVAAISRSEFGLLTDLAKETGRILLGKDIRLEIDAEAALVSAEAG